MLKKISTTGFFMALVMLFSSGSVIADSRIKVDLPDMMREHMMSNMRGHLQALEIITRNLAEHNYEQAADEAEKSLGMSSLESHGAKHLGKFMPAEMAAIGQQMHHAASRFALAARDAEVEGGLDKAFGALSDVMQNCLACHSAYRVH
jgi:cytochrome c556